MTKDHVAADPLDHHEHAPGQGPLDENENPQSRGDRDGDENDFKPGDEVDPPPVRVPKRVDPGAAPQRIVKAGHLEELGGLKQAALEQPGWVGGARPKSAEERLRAGVPYSKSSIFPFTYFTLASQLTRRSAEYKYVIIQPPIPNHNLFRMLTSLECARVSGTTSSRYFLEGLVYHVFHISIRTFATRDF